MAVVVVEFVVNLSYFFKFVVNLRIFVVILSEFCRSFVVDSVVGFCRSFFLFVVDSVVDQVFAFTGFVTIVYPVSQVS